MKIQNSRWRQRLPVGVALGVAVALFPGALFGQAANPYPRRDFQAWTSLKATHALSEKTDFFVGAGLRYGNDQGHVSYRRVTTGFAFHWHRFLTVQPFYQYSISDSFAGPLTPENRLALSVTVGVPWRGWKLSDRNRGEQRFRPNEREWRYRNRVELRRPVALMRKQLSVFLWDEVYYSSKLQRLYRNRLAVGAGRRLTEKISVDIFYVHQNDGYSHPGDLNGVGMSLKTRF